MTNKKLLFHQDARDAARRGVSQVARVARTTLGPRGRHVLIQQPDGSILATKDGVTVVKHMELEDPFEDLGAKLVRQVAVTTENRSGDGTTTATILAEAIFVEGLKAVAAGVNTLEIQRGIEQAVRDVVNQLSKMAAPATDKERLYEVATIASNGDVEIGRLLADVIFEMGENGIIKIEEGRGATTEVRWVSGVKFDRGYLSPYFINQQATGEAVLDNALVLVSDTSLSSFKHLLPLLEIVANAGQPLLIIAEDVQGDALSGLAVNTAQGVLRCCAVKAPEFADRRREFLEDLRIFTGSKAFLSQLGSDISNVQLEDLGRANRVVVTRDETLLMDGGGSEQEVADRLEYLRNSRTSADEADAEWIDRRIAQLGGRIANIMVGAVTESALLEKKARLNDALHSTQAAREEGLVPGGGVALLRASQAIPPDSVQGDMKVGYRIVLKACRAPLVAIAQNAGQTGSSVCETVAEGTGDFGYNANLDQFSNLNSAGIVDASKVVREALTTAASLALMLLTSDVLIAKSDGNYH